MPAPDAGPGRPKLRRSKNAPRRAIVLGIVQALIIAHVVDHTDRDTYGPAFSAATLAFGVTQMVSPQIGGLIADVAGSFTWVFVLSAAVSVTGAAFASRLPSGRR